MAKRITHQLAYRAIRIEGGLLPADELTRLTLLADPKGSEQTEAQYRIAKGLKLRDEIARDFKIALNLWQDFQALRQRQDVRAHDVTVREWLLPLVRDVLHFHDAARCPAIEKAGHHYAIGHAGLFCQSAQGPMHGRVPLVFAGFDQPLDAAAERFGETNPDTGKTRRRSPFTLAQEALNASGTSLWAIVSNGLTLRILRDNASLTRPAYIEVDLEALFAEELLADFSAFWLLAHASRFAGTASSTDAPPTDCPWERWRAAGQQAGVTVRGKLRYQVAEALRALGTGFLSHPANRELRAALQSAESDYDRQAFFEELLRLVYRFIFLATVEDRRDRATGEHLVFTPEATADAKARYLTGYSLTWLRERAVRRSPHDRHADLWQALTITFGALARGEPLLGLPALGGLFDADQCPYLDAAQLDNRHLLAAVFQLGWFRADGGLSRVNYRDMGPEELGSVYESLLELVPDLQGLAHPAGARLAFVGDDEADGSTKGNTRKVTGSYYTPDSLVQELIKSALEPVITQTVKANLQRPVEALLSLTVCDPACGSGHFLLSAARRLADEVALHRAATEREGGAPTPSDYRHALRDVVSRCIYGVDKNPMAIQLAKTALWLEAYSPDRPLSFVDHHLRVGDALLGVLDPKVLENGIPDEAYTALSGDDKAVASALKKQNKADLKSWKSIAAGDWVTPARYAEQVVSADALDDATPEHIAAKRRAWLTADVEAHRSIFARLADTYVAAFLAPKLADTSAAVPLSGHLWGVLSEQPLNAEVESTAQALCRQHSVFHWWLAFPQVAARGGFSVMLGNPPWERFTLKEEEFFASRSPLVAQAKYKAERAKRILLLAKGLLMHTVAPDLEVAEGLSPPNQAEQSLYLEFSRAHRDADVAKHFSRESRRYALTGNGDVNTYALFAESFLQATAPSGRAGFIVPTGIATDDTTKAYFGHLASSGRLASLYDFENSDAVFPAVHRSYKFSLMTLGAVSQAEFVCFASRVEHLSDVRRRFTLTPDEFVLINPNSLTCPIFRSRRDAELVKRLYLTSPVLIRHDVEDGNPWNIELRRMLHMSDDSDSFRLVPGSGLLPVYEAKLIHQFDHRWAHYVEASNGAADDLEVKDVSDSQKADPAYTVRPRYWIDERQVLARVARVPKGVARAWLSLHAVHDSTISNSAGEVLAELVLELAQWVAGELFHREAGTVPSTGGWSSTQAHPSVSRTEIELKARFPQLNDVLRTARLTTRKALTDFPKWATQNQDARLADPELADLTDALRAGGQASALRALLDRWMESRSPRWLMGWRDICRSTDERTVIASVLPRVGVVNTMPLLFISQPAALSAALLGNWCSLAFDYIARTKVGGTHLTYGYLEQFPVPPPDRYTSAALDFIVPRILELIYTAHDLKPWANDLVDYDLRPAAERCKPFAWNPERRAQLRAELDAYYARLYGLTRDELRYILDPKDVMGEDYPSETFRVLKEGEMRAFGEYRTRRLVLEAWDKLADDESPHASASRQATQYSAQAMIRNDDEAWLAGLVAALLTSVPDGCTVDELQNLVARSAQATDHLDEAETRLLASNVDGTQLVTARSLLDRIRPIVERLEGCGAVSRRVAGGASRFRRTDIALPADVAETADQAEIAGLLHLAENRRLQQATGVEGTAEAKMPMNRGVG